MQPAADLSPRGPAPKTRLRRPLPPRSGEGGLRRSVVIPSGRLKARQQRRQVGLRRPPARGRCGGQWLGSTHGRRISSLNTISPHSLASPYSLAATDIIERQKQTLVREPSPSGP